ncbi:MAG: ankyrin repeat domain-containing protein [Bryobacterales bacterium]|nr:ankyrin repeat domain-containing protein [Bryobacterales bacterium]
MTILRILFWVALAIDAGAAGLLFVLGLAAAKPSHTNPLSVVFLMLIVPGAMLLGLGLWFVRVQSLGAKLIPFAVASAPLLVLGAGLVTSGIGALATSGQPPVSFQAAPLNDVQNAVLAGDLEAVKKRAAVLRGHPGVAGVLILALHRLEKTPENLEILGALLAAGADPNQAPGQKPLEAAILASKKTGPAPVKMLLDAGAKPDAPNAFGVPVFFAATASTAHPEVLRTLLDRGAPINKKTHTGDTVLSHAATIGNWKAVLLLLERGADAESGRFQELVKRGAANEDLLAVRRKLSD